MDDEKLILLVQAHECIYNKYSPAYKNMVEKRNVWKQISVEMKYPEDICQKRWKSLRDRYVREKRQENVPSGSGADSLSFWPLMETMSFVAPYVVPRPMRCSYSVYQEHTNKNSSSESPLSISPESVPSPVSVFPQLLETSSEPISIPVQQTASKRKRQDDREDKNFSEALNAFKKMCESKTGKPAEEDALDGFGKMIVETIRSMSHTKKILAMQRVTALVMEMSLEPDI